MSREEAARPRANLGRQNVMHLEDELKETCGRLQATIEEYETALERLRSGNEELVCVNEGLQSTNEELEASKKELQSLNEELNTVTAELAARVDELHRANADMRNLFASTQIATIFLDKNLRIRSYTPAVAGIFNVVASDRGRPITDIAHHLADADLRNDLQSVLDTCRPVERTVQQRNDRTFHLMRILPYRNPDDSVDGALITFSNVTGVIAAEEQQRLLVRELNHRVRNMLQVVIGLASQTIHRSQDLGEFKSGFFGRMQALARAFELLSRDGWHNVPIAELLRTQLSPFATEGSRYSLEGEHYVLTTSAALSLGLVVYELATNATKYGALSTPGGRVHVGWRLDTDESGRKEFVLAWRESGGPVVKPPTRTGFGTELVQRQLKFEMNGTAEIDYAQEGLIAILKLSPQDTLEARQATRERGPRP